MDLSEICQHALSGCQKQESRSTRERLRFCICEAPYFFFLLAAFFFAGFLAAFLAIGLLLRIVWALG
jgi:hypothetical protein